jgi:hypothetical protein
MQKVRGQNRWVKHHNFSHENSKLLPLARIATSSRVGEVRGHPPRARDSSPRPTMPVCAAIVQPLTLNPEPDNRFLVRAPHRDLFTPRERNRR